MGLLAMRLGPGKHLVSSLSWGTIARMQYWCLHDFLAKQHGLILPGGMKGEDFDYFAELVSLSLSALSVRLESVMDNFLTNFLFLQTGRYSRISQIRSKRLSRWLVLHFTKEV